MCIIEYGMYYRISLVTHGQDFSHMYAQPAIIHVQATEEDEEGIEVRVWLATLCIFKLMLS